MSNEESQDVSKKLADAEEIATAAHDTVTLSSGVVLKSKKAPLGLFIKVMSSHERPEVYKQWVEKTQRWHENPDHPDYIKAVKAYEYKINEVMVNAVLLLCVDIEKTGGMKGPDTDDWMDIFFALGLETHPESKGWRKVSWLLAHAILNENDFRLITEVAQLSGVAISEDAVREAATFPGRNETG
jgi:hypothetical protein